MFSFLFVSFIIMVTIIVIVTLAKRVAVSPRAKRVYKFVPPAARGNAHNNRYARRDLALVKNLFLSLSVWANAGA